MYKAGPENEGLISDLFEKITLDDMKASAASSKKPPDGRYQTGGKQIFTLITKSEPRFVEWTLSTSASTATPTTT